MSEHARVPLPSPDSAAFRIQPDNVSVSDADSVRSEHKGELSADHNGEAVPKPLATHPPTLGTRPTPAVIMFPTIPQPVFAEPALNGSIYLNVVTRAGRPGITEKVEWRVFARPPGPIHQGQRVALCDVLGHYLGFSRTIGTIIGTDRNWVTFLLTPGPSAPATVLTLSVPIANAIIPFRLRALRALFSRFLGDEHPFVVLPLPELNPPTPVSFLAID